MRYLAVALLAALALMGCGSSKLKTEAQGQQGQTATREAGAIFERCLPKKDGAPNFLALRSHHGRASFSSCAVPDNERAAFKRCAFKKGFSSVPTPAHLKQDAVFCLASVGVKA